MSDQIPENNDLTIKEVAGVLLDTIDRLTKVEKSGASGEATEEQLRAYRLLRMENESAKNFAAGFFNRAEPLMEKLSSAETTVAEKIDVQSAETLEKIAIAKRSVTNQNKMMIDIRNGAQELQDRLSVTAQNIERSQEDLRTTQDVVMKRWQEQMGEVSAANIESNAVAAAEAAVEKLSKKMIADEVARQVRMMMKKGAE